MGWETSLSSIGGDIAMFANPAAYIAGSSLMGMYGQGQANQANWDNARAAEAFSERMSSTAHQREVADLTKAGLNPILSVNAGASSPQGNMSQSENVFGGLAASAAEASKMYLQGQKQQQEIALMKAQVRNVNKDTETKGRDAAIGNIWQTIYNKIDQSNKSGATKELLLPPPTHQYNQNSKQYERVPIKRSR